MNKEPYLRHEHSREILGDVERRLGTILAKRAEEFTRYHDQNDWREEHFVEYMTLDVFKQIGKNLAKQVADGIVSSKDKTDSDVKQHVFETLVFLVINEEVAKAVRECDEKYGNGQ